MLWNTNERHVCQSHKSLYGGIVRNEMLLIVIKMCPSCKLMIAMPCRRCRYKSCQVRHVQVQWWRTAWKHAWSPPTSSSSTTAASCTSESSRQNPTAPVNRRWTRDRTAPRVLSSGTNWSRSSCLWLKKIVQATRLFSTSLYCSACLHSSLSTAAINFIFCVNR